MASLVTSFVKKENPLLDELEKLRERVSLLEIKFQNEIQKKRGPKSKIKESYLPYEIAHELDNIIFIERESPNDNFQLIIINKNSNTNTAPIIELTTKQMKTFIQNVENVKIGDIIDINDYEIINKFAQQDEMGDWLISVN